MNIKILSSYLFLAFLIISCSKDNKIIDQDNLKLRSSIDTKITASHLPEVPEDACSSTFTGGTIDGLPFESSCCKVHIHGCANPDPTQLSYFVDACLGGPDHIGKAYNMRVTWFIDGNFANLDTTACFNVPSNHCSLLQPFPNSECLSIELKNDGDLHEYCVKAFLYSHDNLDCINTISPCNQAEICVTI